MPSTSTPSSSSSPASGGEDASEIAQLIRGGPSSSRRRSADVVWPEHFVEAVAAQVSANAARDAGRTAAAPAIAAVFQVCSTWRAISRSELLWQELTRRVWCRHRRLLPTWQAEFARLHRTARNFRTHRSVHSHVLPTSSALSCRRLAFSYLHLAAGFIDGSVRVFDLSNNSLIATYGPLAHRERLGPFSQSISGLVLDLSRLVYASHDGDVHVASLDPIAAPARRAHVGSLVENGALVDFAGDGRWWVGLFAGVPGRSWHVWDSGTELLVYVGGDLTDPCSVMGWHVLTDVGAAVGRVRMAGPGVAVGWTDERMQVLSLEDGGVVRYGGGFLLRHGAAMGAADGCEGRVVVVDQRGVATVYNADTMEEVCRFRTVRRGGGAWQDEGGGAAAAVVGCMNWDYVIVCLAGGRVRVWDVMTGEFLYRFRERIGGVAAVTASDRYVAAWAGDTGLHVWDYGAL